MVEREIAIEKDSKVFFIKKLHHNGLDIPTPGIRYFLIHPQRTNPVCSETIVLFLFFYPIKCPFKSIPCNNSHNCPCFLSLSFRARESFTAYIFLKKNFFTRNFVWEVVVGPDLWRYFRKDGGTIEQANDSVKEYHSSLSWSSWCSFFILVTPSTGRLYKAKV